MFSITPATGRFTRAAMAAARRATRCAASWGVVTITSEAVGRSWAIEIATSPVPGGRSTRR
jgi:hypothetical protein